MGEATLLRSAYLHLIRKGEQAQQPQQGLRDRAAKVQEPTPSDTEPPQRPGGAAGGPDRPPRANPVLYRLIELYKRDVDRTLLRENLRLTPEERIRKAEADLAFTEELRRTGKSLGRDG